MLDYNLLVSFRPGKEKEAEDEIVKRSMDAGETIEDWNVSMDPNLYLVRISGDPKKRCRRLPGWQCISRCFAYTLQWIPVDEWIPSDIDAVNSAVERYAEQAEDDTSIDIKMLHTCSSDSGRVSEMFESMSREGGNVKIVVRAMGDTASISMLKTMR